MELSTGASSRPNSYHLNPETGYGLTRYTLVNLGMELEKKKAGIFTLRHNFRIPSSTNCVG